MLQFITLPAHIHNFTQIEFVVEPEANVSIRLNSSILISIQLVEVCFRGTLHIECTCQIFTCSK